MARPGLILDAGPLIAWYDEGDREAQVMEAWASDQASRPAFGKLVTLDHVVDEVHNYLRRNVGLPATDAFLQALTADTSVAIEAVDTRAVVRRLKSLPPMRRDTALTFTDVALAELARQSGVRHVLSFDRALGALGVDVVVPGE